MVIEWWLKYDWKPFPSSFIAIQPLFSYHLVNWKVRFHRVWVMLCSDCVMVYCFAVLWLVCAVRDLEMLWSDWVMICSDWVMICSDWVMICSDWVMLCSDLVVPCSDAIMLCELQIFIKCDCESIWNWTSLKQERRRSP